MKENIISDKSKKFALRIIRLYNHVQEENHEYVITKQVLKSGTSIGANIAEALRGESKADFYHKLNIALKEAAETEYWLELLYLGGYIEEDSYNSIFNDCEELIKLLVAITKTQKENQ